MTLRAAVIGAGPAGFYATDQLLRSGFAVDLYDALPTPFGLVRSGVAPDHPKIKSVSRVFERTAEHEAFRFFGGVEFGSDVTREELLDRYETLLYAVGTATDNRLSIPGEERAGSVAATEFVAWYNGHPGFADHDFDLSCSRAVVIGNGNVAIDVARLLVLDPDEFSVTDTANHAIEGFAGASVSDVIVLGRRGPVQAAFTTPELRELGQLKRADVLVDPTELELDERSAAWLASDAASTTVKRNVELLRDYARRNPSGASHRIDLRFCRSPLELIGEDGGAVTGVRVVRNRLEPDEQGGLRAVPTGEEEILECGLVVRSIGYRGRPLPGVPFDERRGLIRNDAGRVTDEEGNHLPGEYVVGWIKRGPSGVIGTNKKDAAETTAQVLADAGSGVLNEPTAPNAAEEIEAWLRRRVPGAISWTGWQAIDEHERRAGQPSGRPRVKVVRVPEMAAIAERATRPPG